METRGAGVQRRRGKRRSSLWLDQGNLRRPDGCDTSLEAPKPGCTSLAPPGSGNVGICRVSDLRSVTPQRCRQMAARSHRLVLSNTAPRIQPSLLMSVARPQAPPLGAGSVSVPPITGHFTGSPVLKNAPRFPTASPPSSTTLAQALVGLAGGDQHEPPVDRLECHTWSQLTETRSRRSTSGL